MKITQPSVGIYVDLQNVLSIQKQPNLLLDFAKSKGDLIRKNLYYNSQSQNQSAIQKKLESLGFDCVDVPCPVKNSADNQLKSDLMDDIYSDRSPDLIILVSGDGDFVNPIRFSKERGKKAIVIAQLGNVKQQLKNLADEFHFIEDLPELVENKNKHKTTDLPSEITWENAVRCLIETISNALNDGKPTSLSYIGQLLKQSSCFPKSQEFPVVCKKDGTTFSKLKKFVLAVADDGKVILEGDRLFLTGQ